MSATLAGLIAEMSAKSAAMWIIIVLAIIALLFFIFGRRGV